MHLRDRPTSPLHALPEIGRHPEQVRRGPSTGGEIPSLDAVSRHDLRIARILTLAGLLGMPLSVSYLDSCDVRALPVILEQLEGRYRRWAERHAGQRAPGHDALWRAREGAR